MINRPHRAAINQDRNVRVGMPSVRNGTGPATHEKRVFRLGRVKNREV